MPDKRGSISSAVTTHIDTSLKGDKSRGCKSCDFPDGAYELMKYAETSKQKTGIVWHASDNEGTVQIILLFVLCFISYYCIISGVITVIP